MLCREAPALTRRLPRWTVQGKEAATEKQYFNEDDEKLMRVRLHFTQSRCNTTTPFLTRPLLGSPRLQKLLAKMKSQAAPANPATKSVERQRLDALVGEPSTPVTAVLLRINLRPPRFSQTSTRSRTPTRRL